MYDSSIPKFERLISNNVDMQPYLIQSVGKRPM
jgi:hypothetical protein